MQGRTGAAFPSAIAAVAVAVSTLPFPAFGSVAHAETCLAAPNTTAPQGSHWYYRLERPSQRKCWHLAQKDQKIRRTAAPTSPQPNPGDEADAPASAPATNVPIANTAAASVPAANTAATTVPAAIAPAVPAQTQPTPVIRNLVTRNVSNTDDVAQSTPQAAPPPDASAAATPTEMPSAPPAPTQAIGNQRLAPAAAEQPAAQAGAAPEQSSSSNSSGGPTFGLLLTALAVLGLLAGAGYLVMSAMRRRGDVLTQLAEADRLPLEAAPELSPAEEDAPTFAPLPPINLAPRSDDVDEAMRRFARNFRRNAA